MIGSEGAPDRSRSWLAGRRVAPRGRLLVLLGVVAAAVSAAAWLCLRPIEPSANDWGSRPVAELAALARREPRNPGPLLGLGIQFARAGDLQRARAELERCLSLAPRSRDACIRLAEIASRQGDDRRAAELYSRAVSIDPAFDEGYLQAADALTRQQSYRQARPLAMTYSRRRRDDWRGPFLLGQISAGEGKMPEALAHYTEAKRRAPDHAPTYLNAGVTLLYGPATPDRLAAAAGWFQRGLVLSPEYPELHYYLGLVRFRQRQWSEADRDLRGALELDPSLTEAYYPRAQSLRKLGRTEEADLCLELYRHGRARVRRG